MVEVGVSSLWEGCARSFVSCIASWTFWIPQLTVLTSCTMAITPHYMGWDEKKTCVPVKAEEKKLWG